jgi:type I restriction enzyme S subunit
MAYQATKIGDFCITGTGGTPSRDKLARFYEKGTIPWVKSGELRETIINDTEEHITEVALAETNLKLIPAGSLLLAMYGATVGRLGILGVKATTNQAVCHIIPNPNIADTRYLFHTLHGQASQFVRRGVGGAQPNISQTIVREFRIPLPPLAEQQRIAAILDKVDQIKHVTRESLEKLDELLAVLQRQAFRGEL